MPRFGFTVSFDTDTDRSQIEEVLDTLLERVRRSATSGNGVHSAAAELGRRGGLSKSRRKVEAARKNAMNGGRKKKEAQSAA